MKQFVLYTFMLLGLLAGCERQETGSTPAQNASVSSPASQTVPAQPILSLQFRTSGESFYTDIKLENDVLTYIYFKDIDNHCAEWFKSEPCWTPADLQTVTLHLAPEDRTALINQIQTSGILSLSADVFGVTNLRQRAYSERLAVKLGDLERQLTYRSHPEAAAKPEAFAQIEKTLRSYIRFKSL